MTTINIKELTGGNTRMHAIATVLEVNESGNANRNLIITFQIEERLSSYVISGLDTLYQAYFPGVTSVARTPYNYDRLIESLGGAIRIENDGSIDLRQIIGRKFIITIVEQTAPNGDYTFKNLWNVIEYPVQDVPYSEPFFDARSNSEAENDAISSYVESLHQLEPRDERDESELPDMGYGGTF